LGVFCTESDCSPEVGAASVDVISMRVAGCRARTGGRSVGGAH
jgi:hypothetical protein